MVHANSRFLGHFYGSHVCLRKQTWSYIISLGKGVKKGCLRFVNAFLGIYKKGEKRGRTTLVVCFPLFINLSTARRTYGFR